MSGVDHRALGVSLFNGTWDLIGAARTPAEDERMVHMAHASRHHWGEVGEPVNLARGDWLLSRVYVLVGRPEPALHHAHQVLSICTANGIGDWDLGFAYEAVARAELLAGNVDAARDAHARGLAQAAEVAEEEDRELLLTDLGTIALP